MYPLNIPKKEKKRNTMVSKPSDKLITVEQINYMLTRLVELKFKDSNPIIQTLMSLKDIDNKVNNNTKQEGSK